jgi:hypothetical protein
MEPPLGNAEGVTGITEGDSDGDSDDESVGNSGGDCDIARRVNAVVQVVSQVTAVCAMARSMMLPFVPIVMLIQRADCPPKSTVGTHGESGTENPKDVLFAGAI